MKSVSAGPLAVPGGNAAVRFRAAGNRFYRPRMRSSTCSSRREGRGAGPLAPTPREPARTCRDRRPGGSSPSRRGRPRNRPSVSPKVRFASPEHPDLGGAEPQVVVVKARTCQPSTRSKSSKGHPVTQGRGTSLMPYPRPVPRVARTSPMGEAHVPRGRGTSFMRYPRPVPRVARTSPMGEAHPSRRWVHPSCVKPRPVLE